MRQLSHPCIGVVRLTLILIAVGLPLGCAPPNSAQRAALSRPEPPTAPTRQGRASIGSAMGTTLALEVDQWQGGSEQGPQELAQGRRVRWLTNESEATRTMVATLQIEGRPLGEALLLMEALDTAGGRTPFMVWINGIAIAPAPLRLADEAGALPGPGWHTATWRVPARLLRPGVNHISLLRADEPDNVALIGVAEVELSYEAQAE
ncbi:hypothetical protein [Kallotenue papyrolyticum]|uniref:hypothetical protein n=1 Tax=Kallotenue papyrolyticum TaxID=1325125 RepID=UPI0004785610|nr:hypothetical protein [Kallotenue papyrolyticum]